MLINDNIGKKNLDLSSKFIFFIQYDRLLLSNKYFIEDLIF